AVPSPVFRPSPTSLPFSSTAPLLSSTVPSITSPIVPSSTDRSAAAVANCFVGNLYDYMLLSVSKPCEEEGYCTREMNRGETKGQHKFPGYFCNFYVSADV
ncbi:hypothetical protein M8C21_019550, partial [Ambrosia artemisiifolia]